MFKKQNKATCFFCGSEKERWELESHHYPKKKSEGGTKTVLACIDCHEIFHRSEDGFSILETYGTAGTHREAYLEKNEQRHFLGILKIQQPK